MSEEYGLKILIHMNHRWLLLFVSVIFSVINCAFAEEYTQISLGGFSPDGKKLLLSYCTNKPVCRFGTFDLRNKVFLEIVPRDPDQVWTPGGFSPDGSQVAISVLRNSDNGRFAQIGILHLDTKKLKELSKSPSQKTAPSFSHDGRKIIFAQSNRQRESGKTRFSNWDIYEIGIDDKNERRLTAFRFFAITPPAYLPDDRRFIFAGEAPSDYVSPLGDTGYKAYAAQFHENEIFVLAPTSEQILAPVITNGDMSSHPAISADGARIVYVARTDKQDGVKTRFTYDLFLFDGKEHRRLTRMNGVIRKITLSPDGDTVAFVRQGHESFTTRDLNLLDVRTNRLELLDPAQLGIAQVIRP